MLVDSTQYNIKDTECLNYQLYKPKSDLVGSKRMTKSVLHCLFRTLVSIGFVCAGGFGHMIKENKIELFLYSEKKDKTRYIFLIFLW